tara:strand:- start:13249 stop:13479 length:231 start_codon:yes stop_codon:yes gene_type:complete
MTLKTRGDIYFLKKVKEIIVASTKEMAEAHLQNVDQQIQQLVQQKAAIESDIEQLTKYLEDGAKELSSKVDETSGS